MTIQRTDGGSRQRQITPLYGCDAGPWGDWTGVAQGVCIILGPELRSLGPLPGAICAGQSAALGVAHESLKSSGKLSLTSAVTRSKPLVCRKTWFFQTASNTGC